MDRNLIICDNLSTFAPNSVAVFRAAELQQTSQVKLIELKTSNSGASETEGSIKHEFEFNSVSLTCGQRFDFGFGLQLRRMVAEFRPTTVHLFCDRPQKLLSLLAFCKTPEIQVHLVHRWPSISMFSRFLNPVVHGRRIKWSVTCREIAQDLIHANINPDDINVKAIDLPTGIFDRPRLFDPDQVKAEFDEADVCDGNIRLISIVAPLRQESGLRDLIWACELLRAVRDDLQIAVIGDNDIDGHEFDDGQHLNQLNRFIEATDLRDHIHFVGWSDSAAEIIAASDIYCETSGWIPNSLALQFARQNGIPTAIVESPFNRRNFSNGHDCLMFPAGEKNEIGRRIRKLLDDKELAMQIADQAAHKKLDLVAA